MMKRVEDLCLVTKYSIAGWSEEWRNGICTRYFQDLPVMHKGRKGSSLNSTTLQSIQSNKCRYFIALFLNKK